MEDCTQSPSPELIEMERYGWKFTRNDSGKQEWYLPNAFMKPCCWEDAKTLHATIKSWGKGE